MPRIALTTGEPAGIGPDLALSLAQQDLPRELACELACELVVLADRDLLAQRAAQLGLKIALTDYSPQAAPTQTKNSLTVLHVPLATRCVAGELDSHNAAAVLAMLDRASDGCQAGEFAAMVTAPVQKSVINAAGIPFSGHTEYLAERLGAPLPVMMLTAGTLRVALVTTHLPLAKVPAAITQDRLRQTLRILHHDLKTKFGMRSPRIMVLGLNPHAGEAGYLGREEIDIINPVIAELRAQGLQLTDALPADTAFTPRQLNDADAVLAMYHDQGLPVLKHAGFGNAVNVTLGLPIIRTSVDHGTALSLAGTGKADAGSLQAALALAIELANVHVKHTQP